MYLKQCSDYALVISVDLFFCFFPDVIKYGTATIEACIGRVSVKPVLIPTIEFDLIVNWNNL